MIYFFILQKQKEKNLLEKVGKIWAIELHKKVSCPLCVILITDICNTLQCTSTVLS